MATVRIGMIGSGYMGLTYAEAIARHVKGAALGAVAGGSRATALAASYGVPAEPNVNALLERADIDAVIITSPDQNHCEQTLQAAAQGKHVLVEKPMAPTVKQCESMIAACSKSGVNLAVVKTERYRPLTKRAKQLIDEGAIGKIRMLRTVSVYPVSLGSFILDSRPFYKDPASGGLFMSIASHNADFLFWLSGLAATQVYAQAHTYSDLGAPEQSVMAQIRFTDGVMGDMWISSELPQPSFPNAEVRFQVVGSKGLLDFENYGYLDVTRGDKWERDFVPEKFDYLNDPKSPIRLEPHIGVVQEFVDSILEKRAPKVGGPAGRAAVEVCEACQISAREGRAVDLPLR
jgi:UDP-N-acetyl-2-amino-2-deoxyglucuronate dehydrogenase